MSDPSNTYGFTYFDKVEEYRDEAGEAEIEDSEKSCPGNCCDHDCECDDCDRCSSNSRDKEDDFSDVAAA